jgi:hypothetical protein
MFMAGFDIGDESYILTHDVNDDSRSVSSLDEKGLVHYDASCNVKLRGKRVGRLIGYTGTWQLEGTDGKVAFVTKQPTRDYDWRTLLAAEVEVAKHLLTKEL